MTPIRVLYDEQIFLLQRHGGISRYFVELIKQFQDNPHLGIEPVVELKAARNEYFLERFRDMNPKIIRTKRRAALSLCILMMKNRTACNSADLVHLTFYLPGFLGRFPNLPKVTTLFDMIPETETETFRLWNPHFAKKNYLKNADTVLSISETSTSDLRNILNFGLPVMTTYLGVGGDFRPGLNRPPLAPENYLLMVGNRQGYKNWKTVVKAFSLVVQEWPDLVLVLAGGGTLSNKEKRILRNLDLTRNVQQHDFPDSELPHIFSNAQVLIAPSKKEGFGIPLVEAMASGIPVIASDTSSNREICEGAASYFPSDQIESLADIILGLLKDPASASAKAKAGLARAAYFSWRKCAVRTANAYKETMKSRRESTHFQSNETN